MAAHNQRGQQADTKQQHAAPHRPAHNMQPHHRPRPQQRRRPAPLALLLAALLAAPAAAVKLKFVQEECLSYTFNQYEYFYGSFVALPDQFGTPAKYDLTVTAPSGAKLYEVYGESEATFHLVPVEAGHHRFCLRFNADKSPSRAAVVRDVLWNINIGYSEGHDKVEETDTQYLWHHVYQIDGQVQELKSTLHYLYWRERRHRQTVESTHRRTVWYAALRCGAIVAASVGQVRGAWGRRGFGRWGFGGAWGRGRLPNSAAAARVCPCNRSRFASPLILSHPPTPTPNNPPPQVLFIRRMFSKSPNFR